MINGFERESREGCALSFLLVGKPKIYLQLNCGLLASSCDAIGKQSANYWPMI
jgi:hypothetical protein